MQLYTVTFNRKRLVSTFDQFGRVTSNTVEKIECTLCDLPLSTARMYENITDDCRIMMQTQTHNAPSTRSTKKAKYIDHDPAPRQKALPTARPDKHAAARTGDMSAAINRSA